MEKAVVEKRYGFDAGSIVVAPVPFANPVFGTGLALGAGYLYQTDKDSNTSLIGLGALRSDNGTEAYGLSASLAWDHNTWQLSATFVEANLNYDLYVAGVPVPIKQNGTMFSGSLLYGVTPQFSFGGKVRYLDTELFSRRSGSFPPAPLSDSKIEVASLGFVTKWDTRDDSLYPRDGHLLDFEVMYSEVLNTAVPRNYSKSYTNFSMYRSLTENTVAAGRATVCGATADAPFFDQCSLGGTDAFRGFSALQYIGLRSLSAQIEVRQQLSNRFRAVAFAGLGQTGESFGSLNAGGTHIAGGVGLRFKLSKKFDADFSVDLSYNDEDAELLYIYVGQRF